MSYKQMFLEYITDNELPMGDRESRILDLLEDADESLEFLSCLQAAGVDNWEGYEVAQDMLDEVED